MATDWYWNAVKENFHGTELASNDDSIDEVALKNQKEKMTDEEFWQILYLTYIVQLEANSGGKLSLVPPRTWYAACVLSFFEIILLLLEVILTIKMSFSTKNSTVATSDQPPNDETRDRPSNDEARDRPWTGETCDQSPNVATQDRPWTFETGGQTSAVETRDQPWTVGTRDQMSSVEFVENSPTKTDLNDLDLKAFELQLQNGNQLMQPPVFNNDTKYQKSRWG